MYNRGLALKELRRLDEALASFDRALALQPNYPEVFNTRGSVLRELRQFDAALASFERALALNPSYADAHWNESLVLLQLGDFSNGWAKYEWGLKNGNRGKEHHFTKRRWSGTEPIEGKAILLFSEQGFGDTIQFCRYVPMVAARGAQVILQVQRPLCELMRSLAGVTQIVSESDPRSNFDFEISLLSLPAAFGTTLDTLPSKTPYLCAEPHTIEKWNARLGPKRRARIGLSWAGNPNYPGDARRSIGLQPLLPLLARRDVEFFSIQKGLRPGDVDLINTHGIVHLGDDIQSFDDTAGIISLLDLVISIDTAVIHLAGALGKPVWVLLQYVPDWRWLIDRVDTPWYPTARLFWQDVTRTWNPVVAQVNEALNDFVSRRPVPNAHEHL
jgi:hypothetical protein